MGLAFRLKMNLIFKILKILMFEAFRLKKILKILTFSRHIYYFICIV